MVFKIQQQTSLLLLLTALSLSACSQAEVNEVTPQGTIALDKITLGVPESTLKEAMVTFVRDPAANANAGGKSQYLSRENTAAGGQYMVQCKDNAVFQISEIFATQPTSKEPAVIELRKLLPSGAPEQSRVEEKSTSDIYYYGADYTGELNYKDAKKEAVLNLTASNVTVAKEAEVAKEAAKQELKPIVEKAKKAK